MKYKKIMMLAILLLALLTVSAVSAEDNATDDTAIVEENNMGTFTDLAMEIANATDEFNLTRDYAYVNDDSSYIHGITIDKKIVINGNGHTIDGNNQARIFNVTASNVVINNINFVKCSHSNGAALHWGYSGDKGLLFACSFVNCGDCAVIWRSEYGVLSDCIFINCTSNSGPGAISWDSFYSVLANCTFTNCNSHDSSRDCGGAINWQAYHSVVANCSFEKCYSSNVGGAFYSNSDLSGDCILANCSFVECCANGNGGAVYWGCSYSVLANCSFEKCSSRKGNGGAIYCDSYSPDNFHNCSFNDCSAYENGGAIHNTLDNIFIDNCSFVRSNATVGGGIYCSSTEISIINSTFEGNSAQNGSDWYSIYAINLINITPNNIMSPVLETTSNVNMSYGDSKNLIVTLSDINHNFLVGHIITISLNNVSYTKTTDNNGQVSLDIPTTLLPGSYIANISYPGNEEQIAHISNSGLSEFMPITATVDVIVNKGKTIISCGDISVEYNDDIELIATLTNAASGKPITNAKVVVNLNDEVYNIKTDSKGRVKLTANGLAPANYTATISYLGNAKYTPASATATVVVNNVSGTFSDLATEIANAEGELNLTRNYKYLQDKDSNYTDGITIDKSITINGNGHTINANNQARAFYIATSNVTLKNIDFVECNHNDGSAIYWAGDNGTLNSCSFEDCIASGSGGAVYLGRENYHKVYYCNVSDCSFTNCSSNSYGGAFSGPGSGVLSDCSFANCSSNSYGGAVTGADIINNCNFMNCSAKGNGGAVNGAKVINNCNFMNCSANKGGAVHYVNALVNCSFTNCSAIDYGGAVQYVSALVNCSFMNCSASGQYNEYNYIEYGFGGAVYWTRDYGILTNCSFTNCSANKGGAVYWGDVTYHPATEYTNEYYYSYIEPYGEYGTLSNCNFMNCSANDGGAVFWNANNGALANCSFTNCSAETGGAVYWGCEYDFDDCFYMAGDYGNVSYCSFVNCTATNCAAGIYFWGNNCRLISPYFEGNVALDSPDWHGSYPVKLLIPTTIRASDVSLAYGDPEELIVTLTDFNNKPLAGRTISIRLNNVYYHPMTNSKGEASLSIPTDLTPNTYTTTISWGGDNSYEKSSTTAMVVVTNVGVGSFTDLANKIANAEGELNLTRDYDYLPASYADGIIINKSITINGNGHTINANNQARAFDITASNVTLNNINFVECNHNNGGAIHWSGAKGTLTNCNFVNCSAISSSSSSSGGAVDWDGADGVLSECNFTGCSAISSSSSSSGGAVHWNYHADNGILTDCNFIDCTVSGSGSDYIWSTGSAVDWDGQKGILTNCNFIDCSAISTSTYRVRSLYSSSSEYLLGDGDYHPYFSRSCGGAVFWHGDEGILTNCSFVDCSAHSGGVHDAYSCGGAIFWDGRNGALTNCNFIDCIVRTNNIGDTYFLGEAVYWGYHINIDDDWPYGINGVLANCSFVNRHSSNEYHAIYWWAKNGTLIDPTFEGNSTSDLYWYSYYYPLKVIITTVITASDEIADYGNSAKLISLTDFNNNPLAEQTISIVLNNVEYVLKTDSQGSAKFAIPTDLAPNTYTATISYAGNGTYAPSNATAKVVVKMNTNISAEYNKESSELIATLTNANTGKAISSANVIISVNGVNTTVKTNSKGQAKFSTENLPSGTCTATVSYKGNSKYNPSTATVDISTKTNIIISAVYDSENNELMATLKNEATGKAVANTNVQININGKTTTVKTNTKGQATISTAGLPLGTNTATVSYAGNSKYNPASTSISFEVKTKVIVTDVYAYSDKIVAKLTNGATGKFIANANMIVEINGVKYNAKSDNKGQLTFNTKDLNLPSSYDLTISYRGNDRYTASSATVAVDLNKANMMITTNYHADKQKMVATLKNSKTGVVVRNANMIIDLNGVKTTYKSNDQGKITLPTADFAPGTYVGTVTYPGNARYNSISAVFKVDV